jgi:CBS domain-containing protein
MASKVVPDLVHDQKLAMLAPQATVREAARLLAQRNIGVILVVEGSRLVGILSERDVVTRVVGPGLDPDATILQTVMTPNPETVPPDTDVPTAMRLLVKNDFRHLPVLDGQRIVGVVSARDIYTNVTKSIQTGVSVLARELLHG